MLLCLDSSDHTHTHLYIYRYTPLIWYTIHTTNWYGVEFIKCPVTLAMINEYFVHSFILFAISNLMVSVMAIAVFFFYTTLENMDAVLNLSYIVALKNCFSNILNVYIYAFCLGYAALHLLRMEWKANFHIFCSIFKHIHVHVRNLNWMDKSNTRTHQLQISVD